MNNNNYNIKLKSFARTNRKDGTKAEVKIWCELLRNKKMLGYPFLRQRPIGNYIADFLSKDLKLIIEVDGLTHEWETQFEKDKQRELALNKMGFQVIRFNDEGIMHDIENVERTIQAYIEGWEKNHPPALQRGMRLSQREIKTFESSLEISTDNVFLFI